MLNLNTDQINQAKNFIDQASEILIIAPSNPSFDSIVVSLALYLALLSSGKQVNCVCPDEMTVEFSQLIGVDKISTRLDRVKGKNLTISFPYKEGSIEKVSYNIENDTFNLIIEPRSEFPQVTPDKIKYSYGSGKYDLIITVNTSQLEDLGNIYNLNASLFNEKPLINIDSNNQNSNFGKVNIVNNDVSSTSELVIYLLSKLGLNLDQDIATNLLTGLFYSTNNFTSEKTTESTFEAAAICLKRGAKKQFSDMKQTQKQTHSVSLPFTKDEKTSFQTKKTTISFPKLTQETAKQDKVHQEQPFSKKSLESSTETKSDKQTSAPSDWLKPKIFKGSTLL